MSLEALYVEENLITNRKINCFGESTQQLASNPGSVRGQEREPGIHMHPKITEFCVSRKRPLPIDLVLAAELYMELYIYSEDIASKNYISFVDRFIPETR